MSSEKSPYETPERVHSSVYFETQVKADLKRKVRVMYRSQFINDAVKDALSKLKEPKTPKAKKTTKKS